MAHPTLAKILYKIAIDVVVDEKNEKVLMIILAPVIILLLITFILYILSSPLSMIVDFFTPDETEIYR